MPRSPLDYAPRDLAICQYVALYRIGILAILDRVFADCGNCGSAVRRLSQPALADTREPPPLVRIGKSLPKGRSYVQLSPAGCRRLNVSPALAAPLGKAALDQATAIASVCALSAAECHRVTRSELQPHLGADTPPDNVAHLIAVLDSGRSAPTLLRVYHAVSEIQTSLHHVIRLRDEAARKPRLREWLRSRDYGFAILCPTRSAVLAMRRAVERCDQLRDVSLLIELGPTTDTLDEALRGAKQ